MLLVCDSVMIKHDEKLCGLMIMCDYADKSILLMMLFELDIMTNSYDWMMMRTFDS